MNTRSMISTGIAQRAEPESFRARTFSASLTVKNLQKSVAWYRDKVGFHVGQKVEREGKLRSVLLKAGDVRILISEDEGVGGWDRVKGAGFTLQLTTAQDIDLLAQTIRQRGASVEAEPTDATGARAIRLRDPDGFKLVISAAR
jgi:uncharacterized glyoxalase superfamily protein PhnB